MTYSISRNHLGEPVVSLTAQNEIDQDFLNSLYQRRNKPNYDWQLGAIGTSAGITPVSFVPVQKTIDK